MALNHHQTLQFKKHFSICVGTGKGTDIHLINNHHTFFTIFSPFLSKLYATRVSNIHSGYDQGGVCLC